MRDHPVHPLQEGRDMRYVSFDLEIAKILDDTRPWDEQRPFGVSCAVTITSDGEVVRWHAPLGRGGRYGDQLGASGALALLNYLSWMSQEGYPALTLNGAGFDFRVLAEEIGHGVPAALAELHKVNRAHIDLGFQMACEKGFMAGLQASCLGMTVKGKLDGMKGEKAPVMWAQGRGDQELVLDYCRQDVQATADLYRAIVEKGYWSWVTKSGKLSVWHPTVTRDEDGRRLLTVAEALVLPLADTSWMTEPRTRESYLEWMGDAKV